MTEQSNPISISHPPDAFLRVVNPIMKLLLRTPFAGAARNQLMVVNFTGRKSGRAYSIPLSAHLIDGNLYAMAAATWKNNFRDGAPAQVLHNGKTTTMRGELITDKALVADLWSCIAWFLGAATQQPSRAHERWPLRSRHLQHLSHALGHLLGGSALASLDFADCLDRAAYLLG